LEEHEDIELSPNTQKVLNLISKLIAFFYWGNLFFFLNLFFQEIFPNAGKSTFGHYAVFAVIMAIFAWVGETLRRKRSWQVFLGFTALLFFVNVLCVWRNWFAH
jgi:uncharacterized membrane protein YfcA